MNGARRECATYQYWTDTYQQTVKAKIENTSTGKSTGKIHIFWSELFRSRVLHKGERVAALSDPPQGQGLSVKKVKFS